MKKGFTLVELLIVVAILGILAAVGVVSYNGYIDKARIAAAQAYHAQITKQIYFELMTCNYSTAGVTKSGLLSCNLQGENLARRLESLGAYFGHEFNSVAFNEEQWLMYTASDMLDINVINARNKQIGRAYVYAGDGYCYGIITTLGDDMDVLRNEFCYNE